MQSGGKTRTAYKDPNQQSRSSSRNQEKTDERMKSPVVLTEQQIQINKTFSEKAYNNVRKFKFKINFWPTKLFYFFRKNKNRFIKFFIKCLKNWTIILMK